MPRIRRTLAFLLLAACGGAPTTMPETALDRDPPRLLSALWGLDDAIPPRAVRICIQAPGSDGMPLVFSHRIAASATGRMSNVDADAFEVRLRSGARKTPTCATLTPATDDGERHTVLLLGDLGSVEDPPVEATVVGSLPLEGGVDARGLSVAVTPLEAGPGLALAAAYAPDDISTDCPDTTKQVVLVAWAGGVHVLEGYDEEDHRTMYTVETEAGPVTPDALGDLGDSDNYEHLCLAEAAPAIRVRAAPGVLGDPADDPNVATTVDVER